MGELRARVMRRGRDCGGASLASRAKLERWTLFLGVPSNLGFALQLEVMAMPGSERQY